MQFKYDLGSVVRPILHCVYWVQPLHDVDELVVMVGVNQIPQRLVGLAAQDLIYSVLHQDQRLPHQSAHRESARVS